MFSSMLMTAALLLPAFDDPVLSGPQPGEPLVPFTIVSTTDEGGEQQLDLIALAGDKPIVIAFVHERTRPAFGLANAVMRLVSDRGTEKIIGGLVYLDDDPTEAATWMNRVKSNFPKGIHRGISTDGIEGPGAYGLNRNVSVTVLVAKNKKVTANFAMVQPSLQVDAPKIFKAIADVLGEKEVAEVADYTGGNRTNARMKRQPAGRDAASQKQDPKLRPLLAPLIQKTATDDQVVAAAEKVEAYAAENPIARGQIGDIARQIIAADRLTSYGTTKCQQYLKKWAAEYKAEAADSKKTDNKTDDADAATSPDRN
ncbi:MAG: hypothetical protein RIK87_25220 [Fuerstiella sp.]